MTRFSFRRRATVLAAGLALLVASARAQIIDPTFGPLDAPAAAGPHGKGAAVHALATDAAGRVLVGGPFNLLNGQARGGVQRLLPNGQPDAAFGSGGVGANGLVDAVWPLPNGQYLIGGTFTRYDGQAVGRVARLNADGSLDATFTANVGAGANALVRALVADGQGRVVVGGYFDRFNGHAVPGLVRLLPSGAYDPSFVPPMYGYEAYVYALAVDATDRVIVGGDVYPDSATYLVTVLERLLPATGAADPTFVPDTLYRYDYDYITCVRALPGGKVLIGGYLPDSISQSSQGVRRLNADGTTDPAFVTPFDAAYVRDVVELPGGQVLVAGSGLNAAGIPTNARLLRLQSDGSYDSTYSPPSFSGITYVLAPDPAGAVLVGGGFLQVNGQYQPGLVRLTSGGAPDAAFTPPGFGVYSFVTAMTRQSGDRLVAAGRFGLAGGVPLPPVVRFTANGAPDPSFQFDPTMTSAIAFSSTLITGQADRIITTSDEHVFRFLADGARDPGFDDGAGADASTTFISYGTLGAVEQPDGRLLVWGGFTRYNHEPRVNVVRLLPDGGVDPSFVPPPDSSVTSYVRELALLADGSMVTVDRQLTFQLRWLDASGVPLASFNGGTPLSGVTDVVALPDTTVLLTGAFILNGTAYRGTVKVTSAGTVDPSFALAPGLSGSFTAVQPDGSILFRQYIYSGGPLLRRLLPSGALDPSFAPVQFGTGYDYESDQAWVFQSTGDLVVGGGFTTVNGIQHPSLVRLTNIPTGLRLDASVARGLDVFPNPAHATLTLRRTTAEPATATLLDVLGRPVRHWTLIAAEQVLPLGTLPAGPYVVRITTAIVTTTRRVIIE